jgi:hypothetical protein
VQTSASLQSALVVQVTFATLLQFPPVHASVVAGLPSLQFAFVVQQPGVGLYEPPQAPAEQASGVVQALLSLQAFVLFACAQPVGLTHESVVQGFPSSQFGAVPAWQV